MKSANIIMPMFVFLVFSTNLETISAARELVPMSNIMLAQGFGIDTHPLTCGDLWDTCSPFSPCCRNCNCYGVCVSINFPYDIKSCD
ncbi:unnamed protein product [Amaranthus hypochondriacus]